MDYYDYMDLTRVRDHYITLWSLIRVENLLFTRLVYVILVDPKTEEFSGKYPCGYILQNV